jgi:tetratricopeptide (TPR) repeat protein
MGQSMLSIWRWVRHGIDSERGLYCLIHGLSLIILTILPLFLVYLAHRTLENLEDFGWIFAILIWFYTNQFLQKYMIGFPHDWVTKPLRKSQFQRSEWRFRLLKTLRPYNPGLYQANAIIMSFKGQYAEAEQAYRNVLAENPPIENQIIPLGNLVDALMEQRKYQQAIAVLDVIMYIAPEMNLNYLNLAEIHLLNKSNPVRILDILEVGLEQTEGILANKKQKGLYLGAFLIAKAWALAETGRHVEALQLLDEAWRPANLKKMSHSSQANMHYMTGRTLYLVGRPAQAIVSFQQAQKLHPNGAVARRAEQALQYLQSLQVNQSPELVVEAAVS